MPRPQINIGRTVLTTGIGAAMVLLVAFMSKPMEHSYNTDHVNAASYEEWKKSVEARLSATDTKLTRLVTQSDERGKQLDRIESSLKEIDIYLRRTTP